MTPQTTLWPRSGPQTQPGGLIHVTTHQRHDLDALAAAWGLSFLLQRPAQLPFDSQPAPGAHVPNEGRFVVDVGGGPLDARGQAHLEPRI